MNSDQLQPWLRDQGRVGVRMGQVSDVCNRIAISHVER